MNEQSFSERMQPYKMYVRFGLMFMLLFNVGYNIIQFKDNVRFTEEELGIINNVPDFDNKQDIQLNEIYLSNSINEQYVEDPLLDHDLQRDVAILNIIFSLFVFTLLRYGKGIKDEA